MSTLARRYQTPCSRGKGITIECTNSIINSLRLESSDGQSKDAMLSIISPAYLAAYMSRIHWYFPHQNLAKNSRQLNTNLRKMLRLAHIPIRLGHLLKPKHPLVQHRPNPLRPHKSVHLPEHLPCPDNHPSNRTARPQSIQHSRQLTIGCIAEHAGTGNHAVGTDGSEGLRDRACTADVDDEVRAFIVRGEGFDLRAPVGRCAVVEGVMGAKVFETFFFG